LAIWGSWDDPAIGAISALRQQGRTDVKVYGQELRASQYQPQAVKRVWISKPGTQELCPLGVVFKALT
jgi:ribose transport system substrate-binding protein